jgi:peroxidase
VHTIFSRAHDTFEDRLHDINPQWSGEKLYQETRKIMGAAMQFIAYNEYLPLVMGPAGMEQYGLSLIKDGYFEGKPISLSLGNCLSVPPRGALIAY